MQLLRAKVTPIPVDMCPGSKVNCILKRTLLKSVCTLMVMHTGDVEQEFNYTILPIN